VTPLVVRNCRTNAGVVTSCSVARQRNSQDHSGCAGYCLRSHSAEPLTNSASAEIRACIPRSARSHVAAVS
jgi:hypothetical protein